ncbi:MAG: class I SAM-dependent methyltransferase [Spirochaetes bacterium]|nr:class I SAM-dependent methyltransferase [Spirochaetota bacterium]
MEPYTDIAPVYDTLLRHVDYQEWYEYILSVMRRYTEPPGHILELGCGTGRFGSKFSNDGYNIYGIDKSMEMLRVAKTRAFLNFRILCADITHFHLAKKIDFIFSVHDTMNYLLEETDIVNMFLCVGEIMHHESIFMFDITTEHNIYKNFDGKTTSFQLRNGTVKWSNCYNPAQKLINSTLRLERDGAISVEEHIQRIYSAEEMASLIAKGGLAVLGIFGDYTFEPPADDTIMINFVTRKA